MTTNRRPRPSCAACRYSRKGCSWDCPLLPYFPASEPQVFLNVHRLYGAGNVVKILNLFDDSETKLKAIISIKYEAKIRQINPVDGCYGLTVYLHQKLVAQMRELQYVRQLLDTQDSAIMPSPKRLTVNEILDDESVGGSRDIYENVLGKYYVGLSDRKADESSSSEMESPPDSSDDEEITNADMMRILGLDDDDEF